MKNKMNRVCEILTDYYHDMIGEAQWYAIDGGVNILFGFPEGLLARRYCESWCEMTDMYTIVFDTIEMIDKMRRI